MEDVLRIALDVAAAGVIFAMCALIIVLCAAAIGAAVRSALKP